MDYKRIYDNIMNIDPKVRLVTSKIKRITMPLGDNHLLYVTTEPESDHASLINKIQRLDLH